MDFETRIRTEFATTVTQREDAMVTVPQVPPQCTGALSSHSILTTFVMTLEEELTFTKFLEQALGNCCSDTLMDAQTKQT